MQALNPIFPLLGGLLIGLSAALYLLANGRVAGISGLLATALFRARLESAKLSSESPANASPTLARAFVLAILAGALLSAWVKMPDIVVTGNLSILLIAGILVGFGTRLGSGCTSGHGVCGLARAAPRSLVATIIFMAIAALTVTLIRHFGWAL